MSWAQVVRRESPEGTRGHSRGLGGHSQVICQEIPPAEKNVCVRKRHSWASRTVWEISFSPCKSGLFRGQSGDSRGPEYLVELAVQTAGQSAAGVTPGLIHGALVSGARLVQGRDTSPGLASG